MYDEYVKKLKEIYGFQDITYFLSFDGITSHFTVVAILTPVQIKIFHSKASKIDDFQVEAAMCAMKQTGIPVGRFPKTYVDKHGNQLKITGSKYVIEVFFQLLFS